MARSVPPFASSELEQFVGEGFGVLRGAFPRDVAAACRAFAWTGPTPIVSARRSRG